MGEDVFARISKAAKKLNTLADEVSARIRDAEARLDEAGAGMRVEQEDPFSDHRYSDEQTGEARLAEWYRVYDRVGGRFRLCAEVRHFDAASRDEVYAALDNPNVRTVPYVAPLTVERTPLLDCDREVRIAAARGLNDFLDGIARSLEFAAEAIEEEGPETAPTAAAPATRHDNAPSAAPKR